MRIIIISLLLISGFFLKAQDSISFNAQSKKINDLEVKLKESGDKYDKLEKKLNSLEEVLEVQNQKIEAGNKENLDANKTIEAANRTIVLQNSTINSFGNVYTALSALIAFLAVLLPIFTYLFSIKPSKDALNQLDKNIDQKVEKYIINSRNSKVDESIQNLDKEDIKTIESSISFLVSAVPFEISEQQLFELKSKIEKNQHLSDVQKSQLLSVLSSRENKYATTFLKENYNAGLVYKNCFFQYSATIGYNDFKKEIIDLVGIDNRDNLSNFSLYVNNLLTYNPSSLEDFLNEKDIVDSLPTDDRYHYTHIINRVETEIPLENFNKTYFGSKINS